MDLSFHSTTPKSVVFDNIREYAGTLGFTIINQDLTRPWGGFYVLDEQQAEAFAKKFFPHIEFSTIQLTKKLSPKFLIVAPEARLSWQYHHRRAEIWKVIGGAVGVITSMDDTEGELQTLTEGNIIELAKGQRHRLIGLSGWGIVAEIWRHTDPGNPSDENDIVRVQDDFGRASPPAPSPK